MTMITMTIMINHDHFNDEDNDIIIPAVKEGARGLAIMITMTIEITMIMIMMPMIMITITIMIMTKVTIMMNTT